MIMSKLKNKYLSHKQLKTIENINSWIIMLRINNIIK